jgi:hypothetical protein
LFAGLRIVDTRESSSRAMGVLVLKNYIYAYQYVAFRPEHLPPSAVGAAVPPKFQASPAGAILLLTGS